MRMRARERRYVIGIFTILFFIHSSPLFTHTKKVTCRLKKNDPSLYEKRPVVLDKTSLNST